MGKIDLSEVSSWLYQNLTARKSLVSEAIVFGSMAEGVLNPSDCDLLIVSRTEHSTEQWRELRGEISLWKEAFLATFGIPLSVVLLTPTERNELAGSF